MIFALPALTAVTTPSLTVATDELLDDQRIFLFSALEGDTVAVRDIVSPSVNSIEVEFNVTVVTATGVGRGSSHEHTEAYKTDNINIGKTNLRFFIYITNYLFSRTHKNKMNLTSGQVHIGSFRVCVNGKRLIRQTLACAQCTESRADHYQDF